MYTTYIHIAQICTNMYKYASCVHRNFGSQARSPLFINIQTNRRNKQMVVGQTNKLTDKHTDAHSDNDKYEDAGGGEQTVCRMEAVNKHGFIDADMYNVCTYIYTLIKQT